MARRALPTPCLRVMAVVAPVCSTPVWPPVNVLLTGALLAPGQRTVTFVLGVRGRSAGAHGHTDHRVWNRAVWSPLGASRRLLRLVGAVCGPAGVVVLGLEETIERRRGANITATGLDRDPVRSSRAHVVNVSGRRWRCGRRLPPRSGAHRVWAHAGKPPVPIRWGLSRDPYQRFASQAWRSTPWDQPPAPILTWWLRRGPRAVTRADARAPLGRETQRPWPAPAMARTTPAWVSLSASLTLTAPPLRQQEVPTVRLTAWSANLHPTCAQAMAWVRRHGWEPGRCSTSSQEADRLTGPRAVVDRFSDGRGYAAALDKVELRKWRG